MTSRLDRLFVLIETGSSPITRKAASQQLGEVVRYHPHELQHLLNRVFYLLSSSYWDTRIAAAQAVEAICLNTPEWVPSEGLVSVTKKYNPKRLCFNTFDIHSVIANSSLLMASDNLESVYLGEDKELVKMQVKLINEKLNMGINSENIVSDDDISTSLQNSANEIKDDKKMIHEVLNLNTEFLSLREINRVKRKAKQMSSKQSLDECSNTSKSVDYSDFSNEFNAPDDKKLKIDDSNETDLDWPFELFASKLKQNLFSPNWEIRHGAACALREIMKVHGKNAGCSVGFEKNEMEENHQIWLEDLSIHLLCVLTLDRFGDFISDQVVAPVRETCAQCLGIVSNLMSENRVLQVVNILKYLLKVQEWEVRHGALLGIKYLLAVREDLQDNILLEVFPLILNCFGDPVDDVSAEAACALNPVCTKIVKLIPQSISVLINQLWKLLSDQDELGVACNSFMALLASLFMCSETQTSVSSDVVIKIVPYLWVFLYYNASSVRKASLQTICCMTYSNSCLDQCSQTLLQNTMRHIFQRILLEPADDIRSLAEQAWCNIIKNAKCSLLCNISFDLFGIWLCLGMQPSKVAFDDTLFIFENQNHFYKNEFEKSENVELKLYLGGNEMVLPEVRQNNVVKIRCTVARMLGLLLHYTTQTSDDISTIKSVESCTDYYCNILRTHLNSKSALQRTVSSLVITEWAQLKSDNNCNIFPDALKVQLQQILLESIYFDEIALPYTKILQDTKEYIALLKNNAVSIDESSCNKVLRLNEIELLSQKNYSQKLEESRCSKKIYKEIEDKRLSIYSAVCDVSAEQLMLTITTQAVIASAVLTLKCLPDKLNPVIKPLMDSIKKEECEYLQQLAALHLAKLIDYYVDRKPCPNAKIIMNLCTLLCSDPEYTPKVDCKNENYKDCIKDKYTGILMLVNQQKTSEKITVKKLNNINTKSAGRLSISEVISEESCAQQNQKNNKIQRQGSTFALIKITEFEGENLISRIPILWDYLFTNIKNVDTDFIADTSELLNQDEIADKLVSSLQVFEILCPYIHNHLLHHITSLLSTLCQILSHPYCAVRHMAARCIAVLAKRDIITVMNKITTSILPLVDAADSIPKRQGGIETLAALVETLKLDIVMYIVLLVIPLLGRMTDQDSYVRTMASHTFGTLIQLMPLDNMSISPPDLPLELSETVEEQRLFLNMLLNPRCIPDFELSIKIKTDLRSYQKAGVNWLAFLNKYKLHGILCDDMGLGKTLQSLSIIAEDHYKREILFKTNKSAANASLPSLVVCPPTLIGHWMYEMRKFIPSKYLNVLQYEGVPAEREKLRSTAHKFNLLIVSYDIVRKDEEFFTSIIWNYCILDEGHIIKNGKTKVSKTIKKLTANHRLILSGTPIQNNVLELWSLFDFLMPGYLGNEKQFNAKFSKPILCSRDPKSSVREQEAGILAMETLHQKVLPFILRRMKVDVLKDLPPKITQDYYCDLSPIQQALYEDFSQSEMQKNTINAIASTKSCNTFSMFQALRYLQSVCNHPKLVLTPEHPLYEVISRKLEEGKSSLSDIKHAAKLTALKQLLIDCGIGGSSETDDMTKSNCIVSQHRALIFCQLKAMLNILEEDLLKAHLPNVTYLRLDGSVPSNERHKIVTSFNEDPSIDILLLTTQIGGLGLNLTGADTVIFVEHDWSPMKDLQAMDRAHRIGQKKVVNVYRLITRATLEQKIMGLQEFKLKTANTIISAENSSLSTMNTEKVLDLFSLKTKDMTDKKVGGSEESSKEANINEFVKSLPELWDTKDYEEEYDMTTFIKSLKH